MPGSEPHIAKPEGNASLGWLLWLGAGLALLLAGMAIFSSKQQNAPQFGGHFTLTAANGQPLTDQTLSGKPYAIYFGFTRCPDVCPTTLARMARLRKQLGADGNKFAIVFVSVDPGRDRIEDIARYVTLFGTPIIGATGTEAQLTQIERGFGVYVKKVPQPGGDYTVDHTASVFLMTATGELTGTISHDEADATALEKLRRTIG